MKVKVRVKVTEHAYQKPNKSQLSCATVLAATYPASGCLDIYCSYYRLPYDADSCYFCYCMCATFEPVTVVSSDRYGGTD